MFDDSAPCRVCGAAVHATAREPETPPDGPVGPRDGVVGSGDPTVDARVCSNPDCASHDPASGQQA